MIKKSHGGNVISKVWTLVEKTAQGLELELWDIKFVKEGSGFYLRIFIDSRDGITIEDCEKMSRAIDKPLDDLDPIPQGYCLEVCSPGIERELLRDEHFKKFLNHKVFVKYIRPLENGDREVHGTLNSYDKDYVELKQGEEIIRVNKKDAAFVKLDDFNN